jgi:hypothetical protein
VSLSEDNKSYRDVEIQQTNYFAGELDYFYWQPILLSGTSNDNAEHFLRIRFGDDVQIGRIEISYGKEIR